MKYTCNVIVPRLNRRNKIPKALSDKEGVVSQVTKGYQFSANEATNTNEGLGKWYVDEQGFFYWGGGLQIILNSQPPNVITINPNVKDKIMKVVNMFETGSPDGNYGLVVAYRDYTNPITKSLEFQITYGRSQTTEFGHLRTLLIDYVNKKGVEASVIAPYLNRIGIFPSLYKENILKEALKRAGKDTIMKLCQDNLFENKYYQPTLRLFQRNHFRLNLSLLVLYDSQIHSGGILPFLRNRLSEKLPLKEGAEKNWIFEYVNQRHKWLSGHRNPILRKTVYRTLCFIEQIQNDNWDLSNPINANGLLIP